jgi:sensor c-di-GMP phosphodiesterase-like protein
VTKRHRTEALLTATGVFVLAIIVSLGWASWSAWHNARHELAAVARAVDHRSVQVRTEGLKLSEKLPESEDCDRIELRALLANSHYVRDLGRIHNTRIYCNAMDGAGARIELGPPTLMRDTEGVRMWISTRGIYAARGHSFLRMDPMSLVDMPLPPETRVAVLEAESGHLMVHSDPLPKTLLQAAAKLRQGELRMDGYLASVSSSDDSRTIDVAARPLSALQDAFLASLPGRIGVGGGLGAVAFALVMFGFLRHYSLMSELRRALRMHALDIALQPIVDAGGGAPRVVGFECLVRWTREDGTTVSPTMFVPMLEATGLGSELARVVVTRLLATFSTSLRAHPQIYVALNLASSDVADARLLDDIDRMLAAAGVPTSQIVIELTERAFEVEGLAGGLERLRNAGHRLSIDDFGTGASNASRLASYAPEMVKVDRTFLLHADTSSHAAALLPQLVAMAHGCGARVVIEGVETPAQAEMLAGFGDVFGQGYYWHRPMTPEAAARLLVAPSDRPPADAGAAAAAPSPSVKLA